MDTEIDWTARYSVMIHRYRFLRAVERCVPRVLEDLERNVFPLFLALFRRAPANTRGESAIVIWDDSLVGGAGFWITFRATKAALDLGSIPAIPSWASEFECEDLEPERVAFKSAVENWAGTHHLNAMWVKEEVFSSLNFWLQPGCPRSWRFRGFDPAEGLAPFPRLHIDEQWSGEPWSLDRKRLLVQIKVFGSEIAKYKKLMSLYKGEVQTKNPDHYTWSARFQCGQLSPHEIAESAGRAPRIDQSTVSKAVEGVLSIIGLSKRRRMSGRKPKKKT